MALALALAALEDYEEAAAALRDGLAGVGHWEAISLQPAEVFGSVDAYEGLVEALRERAAQERTDADLQLLIGFCYFAAGRYGDAAEQLWAAYHAGVRDLMVKKLLLVSERRNTDLLAEQGKSPKYEIAQTGVTI